jgi:hypothetical protein
MAFPEFYRYTVVGKPCTLRTTYYPFGPLCIDYRALNAVTKPDAYRIPNIVDTLDSLGQSKIFSVLDMASGYDQIAIKPEHREKIAFTCQRSFSVY